MALVVALIEGLYGSEWHNAGGKPFEIADESLLESRIRAKEVRLANDADLAGPAPSAAGPQPSILNPPPPGAGRLALDKLDDLPAKTIKTLRDAGFQFVDELTESSLTGKPGIGEASRLSILAAVARLTAPAA